MEKGLISVDKWTDDSQAYFLSHLHTDHTKGLTPTWSRGPIFCSRQTAKLLPFRFHKFRLSLIRILDVGCWHSISLVSPSSGSRVTVEVMAIDAHHCPGAVVFLFRGYFGCLLFTGDFRWEPDSERAREGGITLLKSIEDNAVDVLYLDNTYCNPSFAFPSRDVAAKQVVDIISSHPNHDIIIGIDSLGKEDLLLYIAHELDIKIWVWPERLLTMHLLGLYDIFTTQTSLTRVRAVPRYSFSIDTLEGLNTMRPTIGIIPSGLPWMIKPPKGDDTLSGSPLTFRYNRSKLGPDGGTQTDKLNGFSASVEKIHEYMYSVAYSDHSWFSKIEEFIKLVQPTNIKGIVSSSSCYIDPLYYFGSLCGLNQPSSGLHYKYQKKVGGKKVRGRTSSTFIAKKRKRAVECLRVQLSKVNAFRKLQQGAKIAENDSRIASDQI